MGRRDERKTPFEIDRTPVLSSIRAGLISFIELIASAMLDIGPTSYHFGFHEGLRIKPKTETKIKTKADTDKTKMKTTTKK